MSVRTRLSSDAAVLASTSVINAVLGLVFWAVAARMYPAADVGAASTTITIATTLASLSLLGSGQVLERYLPVVPSAAVRRRYLLILHGAVILLALLLGAVYVLIAPSVLPGPAIFSVIVAVLAVFTLQDFMCNGLHMPRLTAAKNVAHAIMKLLLIPVGIVVAWVAPAAVLVLVVVWLAWRWAPAPDPTGELPPAGDIARFQGTTVLWLIAQLAPNLVVPVAVASQLGLEKAAYFNVAWIVVNTSHTFMAVVGGPSVSRLSAPGADLSQEIPSLAKVITVLSVLRLLGVGVAGPILLHVYGAEYAEHAGPMLMIMAVAHFIGGPAFLYGCLARVEGRIVYPMVVQTLGSIIVIVGVIWLLPPLGLVGVAVAYLIQDIAILIAASPQLVRLWRKYV